MNNWLRRLGLKRLKNVLSYLLGLFVLSGAVFCSSAVIPYDKIQGSDYKVKITLKSNPAVNDLSDKDFITIPPATTFSDNFSADLSKWNIKGGPTSYEAKIVSSDGQPAPCLLLDDQLNYGCYAVSKATFNYTGNEIVFSCDMKQGMAAFADQRFSTLLITKTNNTSDSFCLLLLSGSENPTFPNSVYCSLLYNDGSEKEEIGGYFPISNGDGWHSVQIKIRSDKRVEFYLDGNLIYISINMITNAYNGTASIGIGGRRSLYDNVLVSFPAALVITTTILPAGTVSTAYYQSVSATGGVAPYAWSIVAGSLPSGLEIDPSTGTITGTPTVNGTSNFTVRVSDSQSTPATATKIFSIVINPVGDVNNDGVINITDVILCLRQAIGLDAVNPELADVSGDGLVNITDVILILRKAIGLDAKGKSR